MFIGTGLNPPANPLARRFKVCRKDGEYTVTVGRTNATDLTTANTKTRTIFGKDCWAVELEGAPAP